ncbi:unnamed protein product [Brachionus calyciflorus]|uniref:U-box domain-containing protein n=1 Tax=Brachionus calyciflorus TaxID=104777 RepID=A0A814PW86_9BILA|nr:unnamed protein product [Brachionus calyciflorus]
MANCLIPDHYPNQIDITRTPLAFGDRAVPRLNRELNDSILLTRQRALRSLCDYLHDPEHIASCISEEIPTSLKQLLSDVDPFCRYKSAECLYVLSCNSNGRNAIVNQDIIQNLSILFDDQEIMARKNAHKTIEMVSEFSIGAEGIVKLKLIKILVEKLKTELDEIKDFILDTLHFCMQVDTAQALSSQAMEVFTNLLKHESKTIRAKAARDIFDLSIPLEGKLEALKFDTVATLVNLLKDKDSIVRCKSALAIEAIAITTPGKYSCIKAGAIESLVELLNDELSEMRVNALKAITCLAEAPEGRKELLDHIEKIKKLLDDNVPIVSKHAGIAVRIITWKP